MANEVLIKNGTPIVWAHSGDFHGTAGEPASTYNQTADMELDLSNLAAAAARQGVKADLGATRAAQYAMRVCIELHADLAAAASVDFYWSSSPSAGAAVGNTGGAIGADDAYTDGTTTAPQREHLEFIGSLYLPAVCDDDLVFEGYVGVFTPKERYGMPVVINRTAAALEADADRMYVALLPIVDEIQ